MSEIPTWWLVVTGVAGILIAIFFLVLIFMVMALINVVKGLQPQITGLVGHVNDLIPTVKSLVQKVEELTVKVEGIADSTKSTVDVVGTRAKGIAVAAEHISSIAAQSFGRLAPILGTLMAGMRIYNMYREVKGHGPKEEKDPKHPGKGLHIDVEPHEGGKKES